MIDLRHLMTSRLDGRFPSRWTWKGRVIGSDSSIRFRRTFTVYHYRMHWLWIRAFGLEDTRERRTTLNKCYWQFPSEKFPSIISLACCIAFSAPSRPFPIQSACLQQRSFGRIQHARVGRQSDPMDCRVRVIAFCMLGSRATFILS